MTIQDKAIGLLERFYTKQGLKIGKGEIFCVKSIIFLFRNLVVIPPLFLLAKYVYIDRLYPTQGFEKTVIYLLITLLMSGMITKFAVGMTEITKEATEKKPTNPSSSKDQASEQS